MPLAHYFYLSNIQEEVHKFSISFFRNKHQKSITNSILDDIAVSKNKNAAVVKIDSFFKSFVITGLPFFCELCYTINITKGNYSVK